MSLQYSLFDLIDRQAIPDRRLQESLPMTRYHQDRNLDTDTPLYVSYMRFSVMTSLETEVSNGISTRISTYPIGNYPGTCKHMCITCHHRRAGQLISSSDVSGTLSSECRASLVVAIMLTCVTAYQRIIVSLPLMLQPNNVSEFVLCFCQWHVKTRWQVIFACHIGSQGNHFCRRCEVGGSLERRSSDEGYHSLFYVSRLH